MNEDFEKSKLALIQDLNKVKEFNLFEKGYFSGFMECSCIMHNFNDLEKQYLISLIDKTFSPNNFSIWSSKRKLNTLIEIKENSKQ